MEQAAHQPGRQPYLQASGRALCRRYDVAMLDLDGVVYVGGEAVPGAPGHVEAARGQGMRVAFVTNNASRPPETVADHLERLGVACGVEDVVTSAQAAAGVLAERLPAGSRVVLLGGEGLRQALTARGLEPVEVGSPAAALVSGYGPEVLWRDVMRAAVQIRDGLWWVASNTDLTIPTPYGVAPGHGVLVETLQRFSGVTPAVAGKPAEPLLHETIARMRARAPLMVGDRLDTDIAGGHAVGADTLLVLTGVTGLADLVAAPAQERPTYLSEGLEGLLDEQPAVSAGPGGEVHHAGWVVTTEGGVCRVTGSGRAVDWWRAVAVASWAYRDTTGAMAAVGDLTAPTTTL